MDIGQWRLSYAALRSIATSSHIGLRDHSTFTLIVEEYNLTTLSVVIEQYTQQDGEQYAFPYAWCSIFDYNENSNTF